MRSRFALAALLVGLGLGLPAVARTLSGRVVAVLSGDTLRVEDARHARHTVRLAGLDAPEKFQAYGQRSLDSLRALVFQRQVTVVWSSPGRGQVSREGQDMNLQQLRLGLAWFDPSQAAGLAAELRSAYAAAQAEARVQRIGLWRDRQPIPPWDYRRGRRR